MKEITENHIAIKMCRDAYDRVVKENLKFFPDWCYPINLKKCTVNEKYNAVGVIHGGIINLTIEKIWFDRLKDGTYDKSKKSETVYTFEYNDNTPISDSYTWALKIIKELVENHFLNRNSKYHNNNNLTTNPCCEIELPGAKGDGAKFTHMAGMKIKDLENINNQLLLLL